MKFLTTVLGGFFLIAAQLGQAQTPSANNVATYPNRTIRIIVPFTAGGVTDVLMRLVAQKMSDDFKQPVIVENRPGGNAMIATEIVAKAPPDGYTVGAVSAAHTVNKALFKKLPYDPIESFVPISVLGSTPLVVVVNATSPYKDIRELSIALRQSPEELTYGAGTTAIHLWTQMYVRGVGGRAIYVPYKGSAAPQIDLMGGSLSMVLDTPTALIGNINAGKIRALAVTGRQRSGVLPDVPTINETVLPGMDTKSWQGLLVPKGTPSVIVAKLNTEIVRILKMPEVVQKLALLGIDPVGSSSEEFTKMMQLEIVRWQKAARDAGIEPE
jgi:hypothetical protein